MPKTLGSSLFLLNLKDVTATTTTSSSPWKMAEKIDVHEKSLKIL
jgi:hypothetical protein